MTAPVQVVRLRRGTATQRHLIEALDRLGIDEGDDFAIVPASIVDKDDHVDLDRRRLGPFARASDTSRHAALDTYPRQGTQRHRVLGAVAKKLSMGATADEVAEALDMPTQTVGPRVFELREGGWLEPDGRTRLTRNGSEASVMILTPKAWDEIRERGAAAQARSEPPQDVDDNQPTTQGGALF